jgi:phosphate-selective porin OprO and OprP
MHKKIHLGFLLIAGLALAASGARAGNETPQMRNSLFTKFDLIGIVQTDYSRVTGDNTDYDLSDFEVRRGRSGISGVIMGEVKFKFILDYDTPKETHLVDAYIAFQPGAAPIEIKLGQFKTANSLDEQTSSKFTATLERAAFTDAFELARGVGASVTNKGGRHTLTLGAFGRDLKDGVLNGYFVAGRATYEPISTDDLRIHTGVSFRYRERTGDQSLISYSQGPVAGAAGNIVTTGGIARSDLFVGAETAVLKGRYWASGEFGATIADCSACSSDPVLTGGYLEMGAMWNGRRTLSGGHFERPEIFSSVRDGGSGAYSLVMRYDTLNLSDGPVNGGDYESITIGADWWPTSHTRLGLNLFTVDAEFGDIMPGLDASFVNAVVGGVAGEHAYGLTARFQLDI